MKRKLESGVVTCLGPDCHREFLSLDRQRLRLCPVCKAKLDKNYTPRLHVSNAYYNGRKITLTE